MRREEERGEDEENIEQRTIGRSSPSTLKTTVRGLSAPAGRTRGISQAGPTPAFHIDLQLPFLDLPLPFTAYLDRPLPFTAIP